MSASFLTNYFYDLPEDLQQTIWLETHKGDAGIIIFRNIVGWTIRKQAFKFANYMMDVAVYYDDDDCFKDSYTSEVYFDFDRPCFTIKSDDRWTTRTFEIEPFVTNDARRLNKTFNLDDGDAGSIYTYTFYMIPNNGRLVNHCEFTEQWDRALSEP
jgi:hypothetical protein